MLAWLKCHFCFHKWEHLETQTIHTIKTEAPYFIASYRCTKCGKTKNKYIYS